MRLRSFTRHILPNTALAFDCLRGQRSNVEYLLPAWIFVGGFIWAAGNVEIRPVLKETSALFILLTTIALFDMRFLIIPNYLVVIMIFLATLSIDLGNRLELLDRMSGIAFGFALIAGVALFYRKLRNCEGIGLGDAKLAAASGAWIGVSGIPSVFLWATLSGLIAVSLSYVRGDRPSRMTAIPFGPHLAIGTWIVWLVGPMSIGG